MDVTNEEQVKAGVEEVMKTAGKLNIVVNSAGVISAGLFINRKGMTIPVKEL